ncbi:MAG: hypothetical protein SFY70_13280 [Bacteroidia bacterium]|nr:hypothetical protein [Bacteroidia bacterium]
MRLASLILLASQVFRASAQEQAPPHEGILPIDVATGKIVLSTTITMNDGNSKASFEKLVRWVEFNAPVIVSAEALNYNKSSNLGRGDAASNDIHQKTDGLKRLVRNYKYTGHIIERTDGEMVIRCRLNLEFVDHNGTGLVGKLSGFHNLLFTGRVLGNTIYVTVQHVDIQVPKSPDGITTNQTFSTLLWPIKRSSWYSKTGEPKSSYHEAKENYIFFSRQLGELILNLQGTLLQP